MAALGELGVWRAACGIGLVVLVAPRGLLPLAAWLQAVCPTVAAAVLVAALLAIPCLLLLAQQRPDPGPAAAVRVPGGGAPRGPPSIQLPPDSPPTRPQLAQQARHGSLESLLSEGPSDDEAMVAAPTRALSYTEDKHRGHAAPHRLMTTDELKTIFMSMAACRSGQELWVPPGAQSRRGSMCRMSLQEFEAVVLDDLSFDLTATEVGRLFQQLELDEEGQLDFNGFATGYHRLAFLNSIVSNYNDPPSFSIPEAYDYSKPTQANYAAADDCFYGEFADIRRTRDRSYHGNYTRERQLWQDDIVRNIVRRIAEQPRPWVVFTAGPMGAGKGYSLAWMSQHGYFPLEQIVHIDPDHFKRLMPEWPGYLEADSLTAGSQCHLESAFLQEVAQEVALRFRQHIWVDGSLRNGPWFATVFDRIRRDHPSYSIAIFFVHASESVVRRRLAERAARTGRSVPEALIQESLASPDRSLRLLTPKADFVARINNDLATPVLEAFEAVDHSGAWSAISARFSRVEPGPTEFPMSLPPVFIRPTRLGEAHFVVSEASRQQLQRYNDGPVMRVALNTAAIAALGEEHAAVMRLVPSAEMVWSPAHPVNLAPETRRAAAIPDAAHSFVFSYPLVQRQRSVAWRLQSTAHDPIMASWRNGAFVYFDVAGRIVAVNALTFARSHCFLQFGCAGALDPPALAALAAANRFRPVSKRSLLHQGGARKLAWISPGEWIAGKPFPAKGAFAFLFREPGDGQRSTSEAPGTAAETEQLSPRFFPVLGSNTARDP